MQTPSTEYKRWKIRILHVENMIEETDSLVKENDKSKIINTKLKEIWIYKSMKRPKLRIIGIQREETQLKKTQKILLIKS